MKKRVAIYVFLGAFMAVSAFAQQNKVVVVPLGGKQVQVNGGDAGSTFMLTAPSYVMSANDVSLPVDGTCVVTSTGFVTGLDSGDDGIGPYFRTARQVSGGSLSDDQQNGSYALNVGLVRSTAVSATSAWSMVANTVYNFGCAFLGFPDNWGTNGYCRTTWTCTEN